MTTPLAWLLDGIVSLPDSALPGPDVTDLALDSRTATPGSLFLAMRGTRTHGLQFAAEAVERGARVVLWEDSSAGPDAAASMAASLANAHPRVRVVPVLKLRKAAGAIADRFFGSPSAQLRITGVTGTNGKTTCAYLLAQCLDGLHGAAVYLGTLGAGRLAALEAPTLTTPDVVSVHRQLAAWHASGIRDVAMEVSSHALDQGRVDGVRFRSAVFTNLTRDHLDYHGSMAAYGAAKARLFDARGLEHAAINTADAFGCELASSLAGRVPLTRVAVGAELEAAVDAMDVPARAPTRVLVGRDLSLGLKGLSMTLDGSFGMQPLRTRLIGRFNAENAALVAATLVGLGVSLPAAAAALGACHAPPGRMEVVDAPGAERPLAVIDYAHTPDALAKALSAAREHCRGALWCVFGCGGDRDAGKRSLMGSIADDLADHIIVTDDNPRTESPQRISADIMAGITVHAARVIHERGMAIATALREAGGADVVLIAGKGHEEYQIYGDVRRRFSDRHEAQRLLGVAA